MKLRVVLVCAAIAVELILLAALIFCPELTLVLPRHLGLIR